MRIGKRRAKLSHKNTTSLSEADRVIDHLYSKKVVLNNYSPPAHFLPTKS